MPEKQTYRDAMSRLCAAVNVVTTSGPSGLGGFTASAVCSVTDEPPTLLVCMNRSSTQRAIFEANGVLCVNVLSDRHESISAMFAGRGGLSAAERFDRVAHVTGSTGCPVIENAVVSFDCTISRIVEVGTHNVIFCQVEQIHRGSAVKALVYLNRNYHHVCVPPTDVFPSPAASAASA